MWVTWREATERALYGPGGFYRRPGGPRAHFRTSVHTSDLFAGALAGLAGTAGLGTLVDVGAGRGELAAACARVAPDLDVVSVEIGVPGFRSEVPRGVTALVVANEWLDDLPVDVVTLTPDGPRVVEVDETGAERPGPAPDAADLAWLDEWWPLRSVGDRAEIGRPRDEAWADVVGRIACGVAIAVDYGHVRDGRPAGGTLTGYRDGRQVPPVPDGGCDLTAHVAFDSCAAAGTAAGAAGSLLTDQRTALRALGVSGRRPPVQLARADPAGYLRALAAAGEAGELTDPAGLGGFGWLVQAVGVGLPEPLRSLGEGASGPGPAGGDDQAGEERREETGGHDRHEHHERDEDAQR
ncbi:MAG TPA: SAM-dependent methyltransferase [Streptosporangiales bacterium]